MTSGSGARLEGRNRPGNTGGGQMATFSIRLD
jgi:hypothetical protein